MQTGNRASQSHELRRLSGSGSPGASVSSPLFLPTGLKPLRNAPLVVGNVGVLLERFEANRWPEHAHTQWQITVLLDKVVGDLHWRSPFGEIGSHRSFGSEILIIPPMWPHWIRLEKGGPAVVVFIPPDELVSDSCENAGVTRATLAKLVALEPMIAELIRSLFGAIENVGSVSSARIVGFARLLAVLVFEAAAGRSVPSATPNDRANQVLEQIRELVSRSTLDELSIESMARCAGCSPRHFRRLFHRAMGISPREYLWECRVTYAKELLSTGTYNVSEAAAAAGFSDQTHINRHFRARYGLPPSAFIPKRP